MLSHVLMRESRVASCSLRRLFSVSPNSTPPLSHAPNTLPLASEAALRMTNSEYSTKPRPATKEDLEARATLKSRAENQIRELFDLQKGRKRDFVTRHLFEEGRVTAHTVFATTREINLASMHAIGFDYDYTLANYSSEIQPLIYNMARDYMVKVLKYPVDFGHTRYDPDFAIRGLYYDTKKGTLLKLDYLHNIQQDAVFFGKTQMTKQEIIDQYGTFHISTMYFENLRGMMDNFSLPEACLIADTVQYFVERKIPFDPTSVWQDVSRAVRYIHTSLDLHNAVLADLPRYMRGQRPKLAEFLQKLKRKQRKLFLVTNSPYYFVDAGMTYMLGNTWRQLFDVIVVSADKPSWFTASGRPFRHMNTETGLVEWDRVEQFIPEQVFVGGSMDVFTKMTNWPGWQTLYLGDHIFSDLREPSRTQGWRTGAIVSELEKEIETQSRLDYQENLVELMKMQDLRNKLDMLAKAKEATVLFEIKDEIRRLRYLLKYRFNEHFGSVFRTHSNASIFAYLCQRYADLYTSNVENLSEYPFDYVHAAKRNFLPHEMDVARRAQYVNISLPRWSN